MGNYNVKGSILNERVTQDGFSSLPDALAYAEKNLSEKGKSLLTLLRRAAKWHSGPISAGQLKLLKQFKVPESVYVKWDKGMAASFITKKLGDRR